MTDRPGLTDALLVALLLMIALALVAWGAPP